jgi:hypothetical protein
VWRSKHGTCESNNDLRNSVPLKLTDSLGVGSGICSTIWYTYHILYMECTVHTSVAILASSHMLILEVS